MRRRTPIEGLCGGLSGVRVTWARSEGGRTGKLGGTPIVGRHRVAALAAASIVSVLATLVISSPALSDQMARTSTPPCSTAGLVVWLNTMGGGTAGGTYYTLEFTNLSSRTCHLFGYPGVSGVGLRGHQLGSPASRNPAVPSQAVTLDEGSTAIAVLRIADVANFPSSSCLRTTAAGLRVYPPNTKTARVIPFPFAACSRTGPDYLSVEAVQSPTATTASTCQPSQLNVVEIGSQGAAGTIEITFSLTNTSTVTCTLYGYPGMQLLGTSGSPVPTTVIRGGGLTFENIAPTAVSLAPGQTAYFNLGFNDVIVGTSACSVASEVEITPPNDYSYAIVPVSREIDACANGTLHVSAVFASTNGAAVSTIAPG